MSTIQPRDHGHLDLDPAQFRSAGFRSQSTPCPKRLPPRGEQGPVSVIYGNLSEGPEIPGCPERWKYTDMSCVIFQFAAGEKDSQAGLSTDSEHQPISRSRVDKCSAYFKLRYPLKLYPLELLGLSEQDTKPAKRGSNCA